MNDFIGYQKISKHEFYDSVGYDFIRKAIKCNYTVVVDTERSTDTNNLLTLFRTYTIRYENTNIISYVNVAKYVVDYDKCVHNLQCNCHYLMVFDSNLYKQFIFNIKLLT